MRRSLALLVATLSFGAAAAQADVTVGITVSATGPAASLGLPEKNTVALLPKKLGGETINYVVLDDASDPTAAVRNARKLVAEHKADVLVGSTTTPGSLALTDVAVETKTPQIALAPIPIPKEKHPWVFQAAQTLPLMASAIIDHMKENGVKTMAYIGFQDAYGETWWNVTKPLAEKAGINIIASERFQRTDTSVTGQALKIVSARPDAVLIGASGTPAVLPQATLVDRGYKGRVYQTHGIANRDFLRVGGKRVDGAVFPVGPMLVAEQLPDSHPSKRAALAFIAAYEKAHGPGSRSTFGAHIWDVSLLLDSAIAEAKKRAKPGSAEFRAALRSALEGGKPVVGAHGVFTMTEGDHQGLDARARVLVRIEGGAWKLIKK
jgi:branched-chain amino acid transport system substrate-binding protein